MSGLNRRRRQSGEPCDCLRPVIRIWGLMAAIVSCGVGVDIFVQGFSTTGTFIILGALLTLFFEIKWVITLFVELLLASDNLSTCVQCWSTCNLFGGWRVTPFYIAFGLALLIWPHNLWISYVAGFMLLFLAVLRLTALLGLRNKGEELLPQREDVLDKSEALSDGLDDTFPDTCRNLEDEEAIDGDR